MKDEKNVVSDSSLVLHPLSFLEQFPTALVLTGPTGSGKSALGVEVAERLGAEIVSMDSMALYRGMDVGTAKPSLGDRQRVPHHLVDLLDPWESASVAWWLERARQSALEIDRRGKRILFVGGTPLYLKALLYGLFKGPPADKKIRQRLTELALSEGCPTLHLRLQQVDPVAARRLHPNDVRRVIRALEVWETTGKPISEWQTEWKGPGKSEQSRLVYLDLPRVELYARIDRRVEKMLKEGLVEEARVLRASADPLSREAAQAVGYQEVFAYLEGKTSLEQARDAIRQRSRNIAKRQLTWFRHIPNCLPATRELTFARWGLKMES
jgi:tRNA dimethylallyltransferase